MAVKLPNGCTFSIQTGLGSALSVTAATNATECVLTVTNTLSNGDYVVFNSGWSRANLRVFRVKNVSGTSVTLEGFDTSNTTLFPSGSGTGSIQKINGWTQITQVVDWTSSGGDPQYTTYSFLEMDYDIQVPTTTSAQTISFTLADDPTLAGYQAVRNAALTRTNNAVMGVFPDGSRILYNGIFAFDETPVMSKGNIMTVKGSIALQARPVRYAT